jgi:pyrroloquinoline quinone (PQQ) biosynthesis protein C
MTAAIETPFADELLAISRPFPIENSPFVRDVARGVCPRETIRDYALLIMAAGTAFPNVLASILAICDDRDVRDVILGNLLEEEGVVAYEPGRGVTRNDERRHGRVAERFARAAGATDGEIATAHVERPRWFNQAMREGNWLGPFAYFSVGYEANVPQTFRLLAAPLEEHYGFDRGSLEFLYEHMEADVRHGEESAALIGRTARTDAQRRQAREGARRGGRAWWELHRLFAPKPAG